MCHVSSQRPGLKVEVYIDDDGFLPHASTYKSEGATTSHNAAVRQPKHTTVEDAETA
jgi:hypothetical protein